MKSVKNAVEQYLNYRCSLGFTLRNDKLILKKFVSYMSTKRATYVTSELAVSFAQLNPHTSYVNWAVRLATIKRFAEYWRHVDSRTEIPVQCFGSSTYERQAPYIYSDDEVKKLLECCKKSSSAYEIERYSYFIWYGLMAVTGMRISEVERLNRADLNLAEGLITVWNSKFGKSRNIPLHSSTLQILVSYLDYLDLHIPNPKTSRLFIDRLGNPLSTDRVRKVFKRLLIEEGIPKTADGRPKIMGLRHTFAVNTLIRWYKRRVNIDQHIPLLSTYLGHVHLRHTYWYITVTPCLLNIIASRMKTIRSSL